MTDEDDWLGLNQEQMDDLKRLLARDDEEFRLLMPMSGMELSAHVIARGEKEIQQLERSFRRWRIADWVACVVLTIFESTLFFSMVRAGDRVAPAIILAVTCLYWAFRLETGRRLRNRKHARAKAMGTTIR